MMAIMIWLAVFPTLVALNFAFGSVLDGLPVVGRTFILASLAVPIVIYVLMPQMHRVRIRMVLSSRRSAETHGKQDTGQEQRHH
jgi:antibiotic biosynthesis monooxygenase (ABM) superfamily enzyme